MAKPGGKRKAATRDSKRKATRSKAPRPSPSARKKAAAAREAARQEHARRLAIELAALEAEKKELRRKAATLEERFARGLEKIRRHLSVTGEARLKIVDVLAALARKGQQIQRSTTTPWLLAAEIATPKPDRMAYSDLYWALVDVRDDRTIERSLDPQRASRIQVVYLDPSVGEQRTFTLAEIGPWETVIARAVNRLDPNRPAADSITVRYDTEADTPSKVIGIRVWLGTSTFKATKFR